MTGERIRQARLAAGLSLQEVAELLVSRGQPITKAGLSKYEHDRSTPRPSFLLKLAEVLSVRPSYFVRPPSTHIQWLSFRMHASLTKSRQEQIKAAAARTAEEQVWLLGTLYPQHQPKFPSPREVSSPEDAESVAEGLRKTWHLGEAPLESVTQCIEDHGGIVVGLYEEGVKFDGLCGRVDSRFPVIVVNTAVPDDRRRYDLSHELGHLLTACGKMPAREQEQLAHRFAASFIVPAAVARRELGAQRHSLPWDELALLKRKYGLSMQAWARRAADLGIISSSYYRSLCVQFNTRGWKRREPVSFACHEEPLKLKQMTLRALAAGEPQQRTARSARDLLALPRQEREQILKSAAQGAEALYRSKDDLTEFEAYGAQDLHG
jgi:Zn-dependent peptidase ImmA (M78 family)/transcriptional regulator with XRE-family HTH domain